MSDLLINILFLKVFVSSFHSGLRYARFENNHLQKQNLDFKNFASLELEHYESDSRYYGQTLINDC